MTLVDDILEELKTTPSNNENHIKEIKEIKERLNILEFKNSENDIYLENLIKKVFFLYSNNFFF